MNVQKVNRTIRMEGARIFMKNFSGKVSEKNRGGERYFGIFLEEPIAEELARDGWPVKVLPPRDDDPDRREQPWLKVKVRFENYPPVAVLINSYGKIPLNEETIGQLDWSLLENVDLIISPYNYPAFNGRPAGVTAYLKAIYATVREDPFEAKYRDIPEIGGE